MSKSNKLNATEDANELLMQGIKMHRSGNLTQAEDKYKYFLKSNPLHPAVNHNLGILLVASGRIDGLYHCKRAVEIDPNEEQYYISYADALLRFEFIKEARITLQCAVARGMNSRRVLELEDRIKKSNISDDILNKLLKLFNSKNFLGLSESCRQLLNDYPFSGLVWDYLSVAEKQLGRECFSAMERAAALRPMNFDAQHRYAMECINYALFEPAYSVYLNLINRESLDAEKIQVVVKELNKIAFKYLINKKPALAAAVLETALVADPNNALLIDNLIAALTKCGEYKRCLTLSARLIGINSSCSNSWLTISAHEIGTGNFLASIITIRSGLLRVPHSSWTRLADQLVLASFLQGLQEQASFYINYYDLLKSKIGISSFIHQIISHRKNFVLGEIGQHICTIGDSHVLSSHKLSINLLGTHSTFSAFYVEGVKMYHLAQEKDNKYKYYVSQIINKTVYKSVLFSAGEIDTRADEGIWVAFAKGQQSLSDLINSTVDGYLNWIASATSHRNFTKIMIQGIPAPSNNRKDSLGAKASTYLQMVIDVNDRLAAGAKARGFVFLDLFSPSADNDGWSNRKYHFDDGIHLIPEIYSAILPG